MDGDPQTKVIGGNPHVAKALSIQSTPGWQDQLCDQYLDGYRLIKKLGQGGMGSVYMAEQMSLRRMVALKMLNPMLARNRSFLERFISEAKAAGQVNHRNLVQIFDVGESNGVYYFSMEYIDGESVGQVLDRIAVMPHEIALDLIVPVVSALSAAHMSNIIHRDVKPDNIMVDRSGVPKLADLGIAKVEGVAAMPESRRTESGAQLGTPHYISPEQARNPTDVDGRADVYSLGATLFHMVTGRPPYEGNNPAVILRKLATEPVPVASELNDKVPYALSNVISRMMAKMPHERYSGPDELYQVLIDMRNQQQTRVTTGAQKVLSAGSVMRIEADDEEPMDLHLEGEDPNDESALYDNYKPKFQRPGRGSGSAVSAAVSDPDAFVPTVSRPSGPRPDSAALSAASGIMARPAKPMARPPRPGEGPPVDAKQPNMIAIVGGVAGLVIAVLGGLFLFGGGGGDGSETPSSSGADTSVVRTTRGDGSRITPVSTTTSGVRVKTQEEREEEAASLAYSRWRDLSLRSLDKAKLEEMAEALEKISKDWPKTQAGAEAPYLLLQVRKQLQTNDYRALADAVETHTKALKWGAALKLIDDFVAENGKKHTRYAAIQTDREQLLAKANGAQAALENALKKHLGAYEFDQAKALLKTAQPLQTPDNIKKIEKLLQDVAEQRVLHARVQELTLYPPYWDGVQKVLSSKPRGLPQGDLDGAIAAAKRDFGAQLQSLHSLELELADLTAVQAARDAVIAGINAHVGKTLELEFNRKGGGTEKKAGALRTKIDVTKQTISLGPTFKRFKDLSVVSMRAQGGEALAGPEGALRLALLLSSMLRDDEALSALELGKDAESALYRRHLLRFLTPKVMGVKRIAGGTTFGQRISILAEAQLMRSSAVGTPYEKAMHQIGLDYIRPQIRFAPSPNLLAAIKGELGAKRVDRARALCEVMFEHYGDRRHDRIRAEAKRIHASLEGR